jgi:hypothetical protein
MQVARKNATQLAKKPRASISAYLSEGENPATKSGSNRLLTNR